MKYVFDLTDKNVEYALIQFASKLDVDTCQNVHSFMVNAKVKNEKFEITLEINTLYELLLIYLLHEYAPGNEYLHGRKVINPISTLSRKQLLQLNVKELLEIQRGIEAAVIPTSLWSRGVFVSPGLATWGRATSFSKDERFNTLVEKYSDLLPLPNWQWNLSVAKWCVETALKLDGDLVELGVFKGHTTAFAADYVGFAGMTKHWYLYDTFAGIPTEDINNASWVEKNEGAYSDYTHEEVAARFSHYPNIHVIKGRVPDVFKDSPPPAKIAFLHVDMNSAKAEVAALEYIFASMVAGGIILFDDYGWEVCDEQHQAINNWARKRNISILELPTGQGLLVVTSAT
jgi:hypothetical protein